MLQCVCRGEGVERVMSLQGRGLDTVVVRQLVAWSLADILDWHSARDHELHRVVEPSGRNGPALGSKDHQIADKCPYWGTRSFAIMGEREPSVRSDTAPSVLPGAL